MLPQADADAPALGGEIQLVFPSYPADAREQQLIRQLRSLFQLAECYLAMLIQALPYGARGTINLPLHLPSRFAPRSDCRALPSSLWQFPHCLRLLPPVRHAHLAIHRRRSGEVFAGQVTVVGASVELAEAERTRGDKGPHAELLGKRQGCAVVALRVSAVEGTGMSGDMA